MVAIRQGALGNIGNTAYLAIIKPCTSFYPCQSQQLIKGRTQPHHALFRLIERCLRRLPFNAPGNLQVSLDGRQRRAQLVRSVIGKALFADNGLLHPRQQRVKRCNERPDLFWQAVGSHRGQRIWMAVGKRLSQACQRCQPTPDT